MLTILLGVAALGIGIKGFTKSGLPLAPGLEITGIFAMLIGVFCCLLGLALVAFGLAQIGVLSGLIDTDTR